MRILTLVKALTHLKWCENCRWESSAQLLTCNRRTSQNTSHIPSPWNQWSDWRASILLARIFGLYLARINNRSTLARWESWNNEESIRVEVFSGDWLWHCLPPLFEHLRLTFSHSSARKRVPASLQRTFLHSWSEIFEWWHGNQRKKSAAIELRIDGSIAKKWNGEIIKGLFPVVKLRQVAWHKVTRKFAIKTEAQSSQTTACSFVRRDKKFTSTILLRWWSVTTSLLVTLRQRECEQARLFIWVTKDRTWCYKALKFDRPVTNLSFLFPQDRASYHLRTSVSSRRLNEKRPLGLEKIRKRPSHFWIMRRINH